MKANSALKADKEYIPERRTVTKNSMGYVIEEINLPISTRTVFRITHKVTNNEEAIDMRYWFLDEKKGTFYPKKKGSYLSVKLLKEEILPHLTRLCRFNSVPLTP